MIPLGVKKSGAQQKFRIPFRNLSSTVDADFDFTFVKVAQQKDEENESVEEDFSSSLEFYLQPGNMKIAAAQ